MHKRNHKYLGHFGCFMPSGEMKSNLKTDVKAEPVFYSFWKCHKRHQNENYTILHKKE